MVILTESNGRKKRKMARRIVYWLNERAFRRERVIRDRTNPLDVYTESELIERFRFGRQALFDLIEELSPQLQHRSDRNSALSPALQVLIALRFYANGAFQNTMGDMISVHRTTACRAIRRVSLALQRLVRNYIHLPTQEEAARTKQDFYLKSGIPGIVGCIDGTYVRIQAPSEHEYLYVNRKGYHSINVQLVCDSDMTIIDLVARWPGSTHDARILRESALYQDFEAGRVTGLLLGDSGYPLKRWLMTPLIAPRTAQEHNYNMKHASTRNIVERCIGVLKRRFHCLHGEMRMHPERVCVVIAAAAVLHNICIKKRIPLPRQEDVVLEVDENPAPAIPEDISGRLARNHLINNL